MTWNGSGEPPFLQTPQRSSKPRSSGLTIAIDRGFGSRFLADALEAAEDYVDFVKFGWGTGYLSANLDQKTSLLRASGIGYLFGGTLLEAFILQDRLEAFKAFVGRFEPALVEVSDGVVRFRPGRKQQLIRELSKDFRVISEVGRKDPEDYMSPSTWIEQIDADLHAGAWKVVCEARETGGAGIFRQTGELRKGLVDEILVAHSAEHIIFEAPVKSAQTWLIRHVGTHVNLGNISLTDLLPLETLRRGLRADTLLDLERKSSEWLE